MSNTLVWFASFAFLSAAVPSRRDVTFLSTSDPHYRQVDHPQGHHNDLNATTIAEMNGIAKVEWPAKHAWVSGWEWPFLLDTKIAE